MQDSTYTRTPPETRAARRSGRNAPVQRGLEALLWGACEGWGLATATWIPVRTRGDRPGFEVAGDPIYSGRPFRPREVNWHLLADLVPGACLRPSPRRSPRAAANCREEIWAAPGQGTVSGVLHLVGEGHHLPRPEAARELAERLNELAPGRSGSSTPETQDAGWAHDLRNRLTHALLGLDRLRKEHGDAAGAASLEEVAVSLQLARSTCIERLNTADDGRGSDRSRRRPEGPHALRNILLRAVQAASELANSRADCAVRVLVRCPAELEVSVNSTLVHRAVENLTLNALQASPADSEVKVEARERDGRVRITLTDEGCGMGAAELEAFRTPGRTGRRAQGGTGYGTASLFDCLGQMGAELELETQRGSGTTAIVHWAEPGLATRSDSFSWNNWSENPVPEVLEFPEAETTVRIPRGAHGRALKELLERCARQGIPVETVSCLASTNGEEMPTNDTLRAPRRAAWAAHRSESVTPAS